MWHKEFAYHDSVLLDKKRSLETTPPLFGEAEELLAGVSRVLRLLYLRCSDACR